MLSNLNIADQIYNMLTSSVEAAEQTYAFLSEGKLSLGRLLLTDMNKMWLTVENTANSLSETERNMSVWKILKSMQVSLNRVIALIITDCAKATRKLEFELLPLIEEMRANFAFYGLAYPDTKKMEQYYKELLPSLCANRYTTESEATGIYKYDLSILLRAYNKLEYTKRCVDSLVSNLPHDLSIELIFVNHGSTDNTKEYFESIKPDKQVDIAVNRGGFGAVYRILEGKYGMNVSNDVIFTEHTIRNLYDCIANDESVGWVVPSTPNISNLQTITANYTSDMELKEFAKLNNRANPTRREQRTRLCNPIDIFRTRDIVKLGLFDYFYTDKPEFPDDKFSLLLRRHGYKLMLAKDAYCHHFGSVTLKDEIRQKNEQKYYAEGRQEFYKAFGVDPWGTGFCYDPIFMQRVVGDCQGHTDVLGINCGLGSNSLKIKEQIKEYCHNTDCALANITDESRYLLDLKGIGEEAAVIKTMKEWKRFLYGRRFRYIVWETPFLTQYKFSTLLSLCLEHLTDDGELLIKRTEQSRKGIQRDHPSRRELGNDWVILNREAVA